MNPQKQFDVKRISYPNGKVNILSYDSQDFWQHIRIGMIRYIHGWNVRRKISKDKRRVWEEYLQVWGIDIRLIDIMNLIVI